MTHVTANLAQDIFRFRNDDGSETTATWSAVADTNVTISGDTNFRLRIAIRETAGGAANNVPFDLQYSLNSGAYALVTTSTPVKVVTSANVTDGTATTQQLSSGTFVAGEIDTDGTVGNTTLEGSSTEHEWVLQLDSAQGAATSTGAALTTATGISVSLTQGAATGAGRTLEAIGGSPASADLTAGQTTSAGAALSSAAGVSNAVVQGTATGAGQALGTVLGNSLPLTQATATGAGRTLDVQAGSAVSVNVTAGSAARRADACRAGRS